LSLTRVISAVALLVVVISVIWFLPPVATLALAGLVAVLAFAEYATLASALGAHVPRVVTSVAIVATVVAVGVGDLPVEVVLMSAFIAIGALAVAAGRPGPGVLRDTAASLLPILYIGVPLGSLAAIRTIGGREAILLLIATIVVSDSAQYYIGRAIGRRRLAPAISPGKTVEGAAGGLILGTAAMTAGGLRVFASANPAILILASATVVALGMVGDLFESLLKRSADVKDSSTLIPGHGGVLDRIDSWLFAGPVYYVFTRYLQV
jgi:phosphatidate cytidylyltransferase